MAVTESPREVSNFDLLYVLYEILRTWDLEKATAASVRRHLEKDYGIDISDPSRRMIKEKINMFFEEGEGDENEGKGIRGRKRKRETPEMCKVCPKLQEIVGEGPEVARAKVVKKVVVYGRDKGLYKRIFIRTDDKLKALFPGKTSVPVFQIDNLLSKNGHIQPLKVKKRRRTGSKIETCACDQSQKKIMQQKHSLLAEEDIRSWDTLPLDILVKIIDLCCGPVEYWAGYSPAFSPSYASVSRSWRSAVLDLVIPPNNPVLDLRVLDLQPWKARPKRFLYYLRIAFKCRPAAWTTLHFPDKAIFVERPYSQNNSTIINSDILTLIAEKTPELRNLFLQTGLEESVLSKMAPNWKYLKKLRVGISANNFKVLQSNCKFICELNLYGWKMDESLASMLPKCFPNLKSLEICGCTISNSVLRIISDGHKNLELLDTEPYFYRFAETHVESSSEPEMSGIIKQ